MNSKIKAAVISLISSSALGLGKLVIGLMTGSLAILSEAAHSLIDVPVTLMTLWAVTAADKPADDTHHFGHGKIENLSAFIATAVLILVAGGVGWEAMRRLYTGVSEVEASYWAFGIIIISIIIDFWRASALKKVARETNSSALEADALHFSSDMYSSLAVLVGLGGVAWGEPRADAVAALVVSIFIAVAAVRLGIETVSTLTDAAPRGAAEQVRKAAEQVTGVISVERVRVRTAGPTLFVDTMISVSRLLPLEKAIALKMQVAKAIQAAVPGSEAEVTISPRAMDDETLMERVHVIARNRGLAIHHVTIQHLGETTCISLDLEVDGRMPLGTAHGLASQLEDRISAEIGGQVEVETHIEPLHMHDLQGVEAPADLTHSVQATLEGLLTQFPLLSDLHDVRVRQSPEGLLVMFHCRADSALSVEDVHGAVDALERALRQAQPSILRVAGHAEPITSEVPL